MCGRQRCGSRASLFFKCENFQRIGAFKFRGAYNSIAQFSPGQRAAGVIAYSSGNHAQAIALSARLQGINFFIVMPSDAPAIKIAATRGYGSEVILYDRLSTDREALGRRLAEERGLTLIPPYDHPHVMAGQGTAAKELFEDVRGKRIGVLVSGGNIDPARFAELLLGSAAGVSLTHCPRERRPGNCSSPNTTRSLASQDMANSAGKQGVSWTYNETNGRRRWKAMVLNLCDLCGLL